MKLLCLIAAMILLAPSEAAAYLDPGTGNILVYIAISLAGAFVFSFKDIFYKLAGRKVASSPGPSGGAESIVLFSEGKSYYYTFKPVADALIARGQPFSYYTMDIDDPMLALENSLVNNRYIGKGSAAFAKMGRLKADVVLATTPNIGTPGYPMARSPHIKHLSHVFHAIGDMSFYMKGSLDFYDSALLVGEFLAGPIRRLEQIRGLKPKELYPAGLPYFDVLCANKPASKTANARPVLLIAPSWGAKGCLTVFGADFIDGLAEKDYEIIVRPHPQSFKSEPAVINKLEQIVKRHKNVALDRGIDATKSMARSDLLISDKSCIRFDYAFIYENPVITLDVPLADPGQYELADLGSAWEDTVEEQLGPVVRGEDIGRLPEIVRRVLEHRTEFSVSGLRAKSVYNIGKSGEVIAGYLISKERELSEIESAERK